MEMEQLFGLLELPPVVVEKLKTYREKRKNVMDETTKEMILNRGLWDKGVEKLREAIGEDEDGIKILWEMLNLACDSYGEYENRKIPMEIYKATMKFCTRFLEEHYRVYGEYKFVWAWWFPRQLSLQEFRIGSLEYEFVEKDENSNIIQFQNLFVVENTDFDSMAVLDWVFPGYHSVSEDLPEKTSLQKKMKRSRLQDGTIGWTMGYLKEDV